MANFLSEAESFLATALTDAETAAADVAAVVRNPAVAPFVPMVQSAIAGVLGKLGLPVSEIEQLGAGLLAELNRVSQQAASAATGAAAAAG